MEFKCLNCVEPFQGDSSLLTTKPLVVPGTPLSDLTMKPPCGFEPANPGLGIVKHYSFDWNLVIYYSFIQTNQCVKDLKYKLSMINKIYLHPIWTSDYSNRILSCHVMGYWGICPPLFQQK